MAIRIISSIVGIAILVLVFCLHTSFLFPLLISAIVGIILSELWKSVDMQKIHLSTVCAMLYGVLTPFCVFYSLNTGILHTVCLLGIFLDFMIRSEEFKVEQLAMLVMSTLLVPYSLQCLILLKQINADSGMGYVIAALCCAWLADTGAYFAGTALGKHKLCPKISPKKTVEGFIGGMLSNALLLILACAIYSACKATVSFHIVPAIVLGILCAGISVLGDLCASVIKRQKDMKDYGNIMPGHGGLMDRFDSVLFVVPVFYLFVTYFPLFESAV